jgi:cystathionine beta-lyase/cystathionine gamma-synthase
VGGRAAREARLRDMVRQGNTIDPVIVARDLYGFTATEAKRFLNELECHR